jgi:hypothetical protein
MHMGMYNDYLFFVSKIGWSQHDSIIANCQIIALSDTAGDGDSGLR